MKHNQQNEPQNDGQDPLINTAALWFLLILLILVAGSIWLAFVGDQIEIL